MGYDYGSTIDTVAEPLTSFTLPGSSSGLSCFGWDKVNCLYFSSIPDTKKKINSIPGETRTAVLGIDTILPTSVNSKSPTVSSS